VISFDAVGENTYTCVQKDYLPSGIYNIAIQVEGTDYRRTLITSMAVVDNKSGSQGQLNIPTDFGILKAYPNPVVNDAEITFQLVEDTTNTLTVYDQFGRIIQSYDLSNYAAGIHKFDWNTSDLTNGLYVLELNNGTEKSTQKIILMK